jgi:hypothetical protein
MDAPEIKLKHNAAVRLTAAIRCDRLAYGTKTTRIETNHGIIKHKTRPSRSQNEKKKDNHH